MENNIDSTIFHVLREQANTNYCTHFKKVINKMLMTCKTAEPFILTENNIVIEKSSDSHCANNYWCDVVCENCQNCGSKFCNQCHCTICGFSIVEWIKDQSSIITYGDLLNKSLNSDGLCYNCYNISYYPFGFSPKYPSCSSTKYPQNKRKGGLMQLVAYGPQDVYFTN